MQWNHIQGKSRICGYTQQPFQSGDKIFSLLCKNFSNEFQRYDILAIHKDELKPDGLIVARWVHVFKPGGDAQQLESKSKVQSAESLFWSLVDEGHDLIESQFLKQLLALWLERKKILKPIGSRSKNGQEYLHTASGRQVWIAWVEPSLEIIQGLQNSFEQWIM